MNRIATRFLGLSLAFLIPTMPLMAHAAFSVSGGDDTEVGASSGASVGTTDDANEASDDFTPILITHASVKANVGASATTNAAVNPALRGDGTSASLETLNPSASQDSSLRAHAEALVSSDSHISAIALSPSAVSLTYRAPAQLFGFIRTSVPVKISVEASGDTTVIYPWYSFLYSTDQVTLAIQAQAAAAEHIAATSSTSAHARLTAAQELSLLDSLHAALVSSTDATGTAAQ